MLHNRSLCASAPFCLCFPQWGFLQFLMTTDSDAVNALRLVQEESTTRNRGVRVLEHTHISFLEVRTGFSPQCFGPFPLSPAEDEASHVLIITSVYDVITSLQCSQTKLNFSTSSTLLHESWWILSYSCGFGASQWFRKRQQTTKLKGVEGEKLPNPPLCILFCTLPYVSPEILTVFTLVSQFLIQWTSLDD